MTTTTRVYECTKRALDVVGAAGLLLLSAPVTAVALAATWLDSGSPLIHRRRVVGRFGRAFDAYKIRTMVRDADFALVAYPTLRSASAVSHKLPDDPRMTRAGRWLRRSSVDELPQLLNVLRGDMSLVGPRMITFDELPAWTADGEWVLSVRPGLTGLWQVSGRQLLSRDDRIRLDSAYVRSMSLVLDLKILARTVPVVLSGRGAY